MIRAALAALLSHWRQRPGQFLTLVLGLALATALWSAVQAINAEARARYAEAAQRLAPPGQAIITRGSGPITLAEYAALRRAGWPVTPWLEGRLTVNGESVPLLGTDVLTATLDVETAPGNIQPADLFGAPGILLARPALIDRLPAAPELPPIRPYGAVPPGALLTDIGTAERLLGRVGEIDRLTLTAPAPETSPPLATLLPGASLTTAPRPDTTRLTDSFHLNLTAFGLLAFAVGLFVVHGISGLAFEQRRATFRTLRALGLPKRNLTVLVLAELVGLAMLAGLIGVALGYALAIALIPGVSATLAGLYDADIGASVTLRPGWVLGALGMAVAGALTAGAQGLTRLYRLPILATGGPDRWARSTGRQLRVMALAGGTLILLGLCALAFGTLTGGFVAMGGVMVGTALLLPAALDLLLRAAARRAQGPVAQWLWSDMVAQVPGLSLALMALLLALATNIGVGTMVHSFRLTFTGWLDQRLAAELYVRAPTDAQARDIQTWLTDHADAILPIRSVETNLLSQPGEIFGIVDHATYRDNWPLLEAVESPWDRLLSGDVLINEQLAYSAGLEIGDLLKLGPDWQAPIAGIYSDYGNPRAQAIVSLPVLLDHHPDVPWWRMGVRIDPAGVPDLIADLRQQFDLPLDAIADQGSLKAFSLRIFERTFLVTGALNILTLGVAGFAILTSLLALWTARLPHVAPVWALGLSRRKLAELEVLRSVGLSALTALLALPLGLAVAWLLLAVVNVHAFGWRLPMYLFPLDWLRLAALAVLCGALAAVLPARRLLRMAPARLLQVFAHER